MKRRRQIVGVGAAAVVVSAAWWLSFDRLTADERAIVGLWREGSGRPWESEFGADRSWRSRVPGEAWQVDTERWFLKDGVLVLDSEPNPVRRALRPLNRWLGVSAAPAIPYLVLESVAPDKIVFGGDRGSKLILTRIPAD